MKQYMQSCDTVQKRTGVKTTFGQLNSIDSTIHTFINSTPRLFSQSSSSSVEEAVAMKQYMQSCDNVQTGLALLTRGACRIRCRWKARERSAAVDNGFSCSETD